MLLFMYAMPRGVVGSLGPWVDWLMHRIKSHRETFAANDENSKGGTP
jgi:hypothetical protein